ncbi:hypothetical protein ACYB7H_13960 [Klebsiella pneumoniae]
MLAIIGNKYFVALVFPLLMILCGAFVKKIARTSGWQKSDFYFGNELILSTIGASLLNLYDLTKVVQTTQTVSEIVNQYLGTTSFLVFSFFTLLGVMSFHQDWEGRTGNPKAQFWVLCVACNLVGMVFFAVFVLWIKGV